MVAQKRNNNNKDSLETDAKLGARAPGKRTEHFHGLQENAVHNSATFYLEGVDLCVANSVRRSIYSDVQTVAVDFDPSNPIPYDIKNPLTSGIDFKINTSVTDNEKLGRLISLIPICVDENRVKGYDPNTYKFVLKAKNNGDEVLSVKSSDIRVLDPTDAEVPKALRDSMFPPCPITNDHILIVRLKPSVIASQEGEEIDIKFRARLGSGRENACWSPVSLCYLEFVRDEEKFERNVAALIENLKSDYENAGKTLTREDIDRARKQYATLDGKRDFSVDEYDNPLLIKFTIDSVNRLRPIYLFHEGLTILSSKMKEFAKEIAKATDDENEKDESGWGGDEIDVDAAFAAPSQVNIVKQPNMDDMYEIVVNHENHTLGNLVQGLLYRHWNMKGADAKKKGVVFFGYTEPHPLDDRIVFNIKVNPGDKLGKVMQEGLEWCIAHVEALAKEFAEFSRLG